MKKLIQSISLLLLTTAVLSAQPKWNPLIYTNSTTLYGKVMINGAPAQLGDKVGVFVGDECRGVADVVSNLGEGYVSILIQGEVSEEASFKIWKQNNDVVYKVFKKVITSPGGTIGTPPEYFLIDGNGPDWKPVVYTNSTTLYGIITINNISAQAGDVVGVFVNGECRGSEEVIMNNDTSYVTMLIQGETVENVSFQIWQASSGKELLVPKQISSDPGGTISFININAVDGLVALYSFNNNLNDETKNGFDLSGSGLNFVQDRFNNRNSAIAFDGTTSQAEVSNSASLDFPKNGFTISTWVKFKNNTNAVIFGKHVHGYFNGYFLASVNNQLQFYISGTPISAPELSNDDKWHLVTGVYDGVNATLYIDGVQKITQPIAYTTLSPNPLRLAYMQTPGYPERYNGLIDDARIYNVPLSQTDVSNLFSENNWTAQGIYNLNPDGENRIKANSIYRIDWSATQYIDSVKIEFTPDDGNTWQVVAPSLPGHSESFYWKVPRISTTQAKIRISHLTSGVSAISSAPFIIDLPQITVTSPNSGEFWQSGSSQNISWTSSNFQQAKIDYSTDGGSNWINIASSVPASVGNFNWTVVNDTSRNTLIRVSDADDSTFFDKSDAPFTIFQPKLNLVKPLGGERYVFGTPQNVTWTSEYVNKVKIEFSQDNGANWIVIPGADSVLASLTTFAWTPNVEAKFAKIRISDSKNVSLQSISSAFEIFKPKVTVTAPYGGEQWVVGTTQSITWTSSNVANVELEYTTNNGTNWNSILTSTPASAGSYIWTIPNTPSTNCKVRISDVTNSLFADTSDNVFSIILPKVTVTSPNGGEQWIVGATQNITWTSSNVANVKLEYTTNNGTNWISILTSTPASIGSYVWTIPNTPSTNCKVRISDVTNNLFADTSDNVFSIILPKVTVTTPNGGEQWIVGATQSITWTSSNVANVKLEYTTNNGTNWNSILTSIPASVGSYVWTIPNTPSTNCKVRISDVTNSLFADTSDNVFSIILPKVTVTAPNGAEQWIVGTTQSITWTSSNVANVKLEYTTNNGTNWNSILTSTPASVGSFVWTIPNTPSTNCLVRVSDVANIAVPDLSDNVFSIILPKVTVTAPNGGEQWIVGTTQNITWTSSNVANVKLEYTTNNGTNWISILTSTPAAAGSFVWTIPNTPSTNCLVRVSDVANIAVPDLSDNVFSIILPKVTVTSPNGAEQWIVGTTQNITWTSSNVANVKLEYTTNNGTNWNSILISTPASVGSYVWTIPNTPSTNCLVRVSDVTNIAVPDLSDNVFSIILPKVTVTSPNGGEQWIVGTTQNIAWTSSNVANVKLEYTTNNGTNWNSILTSTPATAGSFVWTIPNTPSTNCLVRVSDVTNIAVPDLSDNVFSIILPKVTVTSPNGGEQWIVGTTQNITWTSSNVANVKLEYTTNNGTNWISIFASTPATAGSYVWTIPNTPSTNCLVRVSDVTNIAVPDLSDNVFSIILPKVTVTSPNGAEQWIVGATQSITWTSSNVANVKLEYTTNNGTNWNSILTSIPASVGSYVWTIPNTPSTNCKVRISDVTNSLFADTSDNVFSIILPKITVTAPNGAEQWVVGTTQNITWTSSNVANVKLEYTTNNGTNWNSILTSTPATAGSYLWTIPNTPSVNCLVRVSDVTNIAVPDLSDNVFSIILPKVTVTSPNGGEQLVVGAIQNITWTSSNVANVKLEYTTNNGTNWNSILTSTPATAGSYVWTIPNTPSTNCKVRISDVTNSLFADTSNNVFSIILPKVTVTTPNGAEQWIVGATQSITWTSSNVANVKLEYTTNNGTSWIPVITSVPAGDGSYVWTIPNTPSTNCKVRISDVMNSLFADTSDNTFSIILPKVTVTSPNGGEQWIVGTTQNITWTSSNVVNVKLEYTTNNGTNWNSILTSTPATAGSSVWTIPNTPTTNCKVRISDVTNSLFADTSNSVFSIILPKVTVTTPNGGEQWVVGTTQNITWTSSNVANVKLEYTTNNGTNWNSILISTPASVGSYVWTIPNTPSTNCLVRVSDVTNIAVPDLSDNVFSIILPKVTVTSPNGGEQWIVGTTQNIAWTSSNVANVKLEYTTNNGTNWNSILTSTPATAGSFVWTIPNTSSTNCKVRISDVTNNLFADTSDNVFSLILPKLTLLKPNGGEIFPIAKTDTIKWTSSNIANVKLELTINNGNSWILITNSTPAATGSFLWSVPNITSTNCKVRISDVANSSVADTSNNPFTIILPTLTLLKPNGGENFIVGKTDTIKWTSTYVDNVEIRYSTDNGTNWNTIIASTPAITGTYLWTIPNTPSTTCKVWIIDVAKVATSKMSTDNFSIVQPKIIVLKPNGGENFIVGITDTIKWTSSNVANVKIEFTTNDGSSWELIKFSFPAASGSLLWYPPNLPSTTCKVRISNATDSSFADTSDNYFSIIQPKLALLKPKGGENFVVGKTDTIKWTSSNVANVKLEYTTNNGTNWISIIASTPASTGSYIWTIPNTPSTNCILRISDATNSYSFADISNNVFSIINQQLTLLKPNGAENFVVGEIDTIKWTSSNVANVKIEYTTNNGTNWFLVIASAPASVGDYLWTIPNTPSANAKVRVSDVTNSFVVGTSNNVFSIILPKISVTKPNGGETYVAGKTDTIKWTSSNVTNVKLVYSTNNGTDWISILTSTPASAGSFVWTIPNTPSTNCLVSISDVTNSSFTDISDNVFSIVNPGIVLDKPRQGDRYRYGSIVPITWHSTNVDNVNLEFSSDSGATWTMIVSNTNASPGEYNWTLPQNLSNNISIKISDAKFPLIFSTSGLVEIFIPTVKVTSPNGGEKWQGGAQQTISWTQKDVTKLKIEYTFDNNTWTSILDTLDAAVGSYNWLLPTTESNSARVRLTETLDTLVRDISDEVFTIFMQKLTVTKPNGGETFVAGKTDTIKWISSSIENVKLEFTSDNGSNWNSIITSTPATSGNYVWTIPNISSKNCKVRISDVLNPEMTDISDGVFSIITPTITLSSPNGGEKWLIQTNQQITWTSADLDSISIDYSLDNGTTWNVIAPKVFAWDAIYNWNVESLPSSQALIRVSKYNDLSVKDVSDNVFTIYKEALAVTSPNGGERLRAKTIVPITWNISEIVNPKTRKNNSGDAQAVASAPIQNIKIEFTSDNGTNWKSIINSVSASLKSYNWEVPAIESKTCLIRITAVDNTTHSDTSDNTFEIFSPKVVVTSPNGGEKWRATTTNEITWISSEVNKVKIEYSTNDGFEWKIISDSIEAASGAFDWTIPSERTNKARVRVTDISLASTADTSNNSFTIVVPEIILTSPAGGDNWKTNTIQQIKWNSLDVELVSVEFSSNNGTTWTMIKDSVLASAGLYNWTIPRTPTEQAQIKISDVTHKEISVTSNTFTIIKPLALLTPQGGEKWFSGSAQQIKWNFNFVDSVKLEYSLNNGASWQLIANSLPATLLTYNWNIPQNISSTLCKVKITDRNNSLSADSSLDVFTIIKPTLTLLTPNGGENLKGGTEYQITWKNQNSDSLVVDYSLDNGTTWQSISKSSNAKAEKLKWVVPKVSSTQCLIRLIDKFYATVGDTTDKVFSIYTPEITVITPKGGETWYVGETKQIKWKSSFVESVKIELTIDNGNSWRILTNSFAAGDSIFSLFIDKTPSTTCRVKISAAEDSTVIDSSRSNFAIEILPPTIHVSILQNPVLTQYCNVVLVSDSLLSALPTTTVWRLGNNEIPVYEMTPIPNSANVYECSIKFDTTAIYNISSRVISRMGIEKDTLRQFAVGMVLPDLFAKVTSKNNGLSVLINPGVVEEKTFITIEEEKIKKEVVYNLQPEKTFKKAIGVELSYAENTYEEVYKLSLFVFENGEWKPVPSKVNKKEKTVTASLTTLGKVKLGIDINKKEELDLPQTFALIQNYPNPFNPSTVIAFHLPEDCDVTLEIYNMLGARITTLRSGFAVAGRYSITWNGLNDANVQVPSGIYLYRLKTSKFDQVRKMILLK